jgi:hypothetical protein
MKRAISIMVIALLVNVIIGSKALAVSDGDSTETIKQANVQRTLTPLPASVVNFIMDQRNAGKISEEMAEQMLNPSPELQTETPFWVWYEVFLASYATYQILTEYIAWYNANFPNGIPSGNIGGGGTCPGNPWQPPMDQ